MDLGRLVLRDMVSRITLFVIAALVILGARVAFADVNDQVPTETWLLQVFQYFSTFKGGTVVVVAAGVTQLLMVGFETPLANEAGKWRLLCVAVFSFLAVFLGALASGLPLVAAIGAAPVIAAFQVLAHQVYVQFFTPSGQIVKATGQPAGK